MFLYIMGHLRELYINLLLILSISFPAPIHLTCFSEVRTRCYPGSDALTTERKKILQSSQPISLLNNPLFSLWLFLPAGHNHFPVWFGAFCEYYLQISWFCYCAYFRSFNYRSNYVFDIIFARKATLKLGYNR